MENCCSHCGCTDIQDVAWMMTCMNCGMVLEVLDISLDFFGNMPTDEIQKEDYLQRFKLDPSLNKKNLYDPVKHMQKILRCIEGDHRMFIPHDLVPYLKKNLSPPYTYLKVKRVLKNYPGGSTYLPHIHYFQHIIQGKFIRFHPQMKKDLEIIYDLLVKLYRNDNFEKQNIKKMPPVSFTIIQILLWLDKHYVLPYDVYEVFPFFKTMKGKQKKKNKQLVDSMLNCIKFDWYLITNHNAKDTDSDCEENYT